MIRSRHFFTVPFVALFECWIVGAALAQLAPLGGGGVGGNPPTAFTSKMENGQIKVEVGVDPTIQIVANPGAGFWDKTFTINHNGLTVGQTIDILEVASVSFANQEVREIGISDWDEIVMGSTLPDSPFRWALDPDNTKMTLGVGGKTVGPITGALVDEQKTLVYQFPEPVTADFNFLIIKKLQYTGPDISGPGSFQVMVREYFSIQVPEPAAPMLMLLGATATFALYRRIRVEGSPR